MFHESWAGIEGLNQSNHLPIMCWDLGFWPIKYWPIICQDRDLKTCDLWPLFWPIKTLLTFVCKNAQKKNTKKNTSFSLHINKSQGQTLKVVGLHLREPVLSHGELYVGCSRVGQSSKLFFFTNNQEGITKNIVYQAALCRWLLSTNTL